MLIFANGVASVAFFILTLLFLVLTIGLLSDREARRAFVPVLPAILCILTAIGFSYSSTHFIVKPNKVAIVVSPNTGLPEGGVRYPGITSKPWLYQKFVYPGELAYQWCPSVTPSVKGGAEVAVTVCITMDASRIDWTSQYRRYNGDSDVVLNGWLREGVQSSIAVAISNYEPSQLTNNRSEVETKILEQLVPWTTINNIPVSSVSLLNWTFTSDQMKQAYEASQVSIAKIDAANNENAAAEIQATTAELRKESCSNAGFTSEQYCLGFLQLQWLQNLSTLPDNFILSLGGNAQPAVSVPAAQQVTPVP